MNINSKSLTCFQIIFKMIGILVGAWCMGFFLLILVYLIPIESIDKHVSESVLILQEEGVFPVLTEFCTSQLDNWTDSTMLAKAAYAGEESTFNKALIVYSDRVEGINPCESLVERYENGNCDTYKEAYPRYWHGYLLLLKPLLFMMNYSSIRVLNGIVQTLLSICVGYILYRNNLKKYIIPYFTAICLIMPVATAKSLQFSSIFYIFSIATIILVANYAKWKDTLALFWFFMIVGIFTSYFDFLTYPLATFGVPFVFLLCLKGKETLWTDLLTFMKALFFWGVGYAGMWAGKWILASLFSEYNVIADALQTLLFRTSATNESGVHCSVLHVWNINICAFVKNPIMGIAFIFIIVTFIQIWKKGKIKKLWEMSLRYGVVIVLPLIWYVVTRNHSWPHYFFTYKALMVSALAGMCLFPKVLEEY